MKTGRKPPIQIMIAGVQKAGTSSLRRYLAQHPLIVSHERNEFAFFLDDSQYKLGYEEVFGWYFGNHIPEDQHVLAKSAAIMYFPYAASRLKIHNPKVQIVAVLRHPLERAYSAYWHARRYGWENLKTFEEAIAAEDMRVAEDPIRWRQCAYLRRGLYFNQLNELWTMFTREQVHVFRFEDLKRDSVSFCRSVLSSLGLDGDFMPNTHRRFNKAAAARWEGLARALSSGNKFKESISRLMPPSMIHRLKEKIRKINEIDFTPPPMNPETRVRLINFFEPHNLKLAEVMGWDLSEWSK